MHAGTTKLYFKCQFYSFMGVFEKSWFSEECMKTIAKKIKIPIKLLLNIILFVVAEKSYEV
jgi:hypothetical protein